MSKTRARAEGDHRPARLREAHAHLFQLGRSLDMIDLSACASDAEVLEAFAARAGERPGEPLLAHGARPEAWERPEWPTLEAFDRVTGGVPAIAWCFDYHALMANSPMLRRAGIGPGTPDPAGGIIARDRGSRPSGVLYETAALVAWNAAPEPSEDARDALLAAALRSLGQFAEVHDLKAQTWLGPALRRLIDREGLPVRIALFPLVEDLEEVAHAREGWETDRLRLGGGKIFVDGTLNSRTAWMLRPFADGRPEHPRGTPMMTPDQIENAVRRCDAMGLPLAAHAIGDGAVRAVLDAVERVRPRTPGFRIEHAEIIDEADVPRFAELGVIASVQPCHLLTDIEVLRRALPDRLDRVLPLRELIDAGLTPGETLLFGSDVPIVRAEPEDSIQAATQRRRSDMDPALAIAPAQALTAAAAWRCFACGES